MPLNKEITVTNSSWLIAQNKRWNSSNDSEDEKTVNSFIKESANNSVDRIGLPLTKN